MRGDTRTRSISANVSRIRRVTVLENIAASYAQLGQDQAARETVERILSINPDHSLASFIADNPEVEKSVLQHFAEGLRKAGLPDGRITPHAGRYRAGTLAAN